LYAANDSAEREVGADIERCFGRALRVFGGWYGAVEGSLWEDTALTDNIQHLLREDGSSPGGMVLSIPASSMEKLGRQELALETTCYPRPRAGASNRVPVEAAKCGAAPFARRRAHWNRVAIYRGV
jgi:hypothetical protein